MRKVSGMNKLNILNLATTNTGGAGFASTYFNKILIKAGHHSVLVVKESTIKNKNVIVLINPLLKLLKRVILKLKREVKKILKIKEIDLFDEKYCFHNVYESKQFYSAKKILKKVPFTPNIIIIHWASNFLNTKTINELSELTNAKIFWLLMDNAPLTGGCHYPWNCNGYQNECNNCPAINAPGKKHIAKDNLFLKKENLPANIEIITCTEFDYSRAKKASIFDKHKIHKILFPIDENIFIPGNIAESKHYFGISDLVKVIFFGVMNIEDERKGTIYFINAIKNLQNEIVSEGKSLNEFVILIAGKGKSEYFNEINIPIIFTGFLENKSFIKAYQAADVFVSSSIEDSGPLMISQSIMCGTPVVAFEMGLAIDLVITQKTGYSAKLYDSSDMAKGIKYILNMEEEETKAMSMNCYNLGLKLCSSKIQVNKFIEIFNK